MSVGAIAARCIDFSIKAVALTSASYAWIWVNPTPHHLFYAYTLLLSAIVYSIAHIYNAQMGTTFLLTLGTFYFIRHIWLSIWVDFDDNKNSVDVENGLSNNAREEMLRGMVNHIIMPPQKLQTETTSIRVLWLRLVLLMVYWIGGCVAQWGIGVAIIEVYASIALGTCAQIFYVYVLNARHRDVDLELLQKGE